MTENPEASLWGAGAGVAARSAGLDLPQDGNPAWEEPPLVKSGGWGGWDGVGGCGGRGDSVAPELVWSNGFASFFSSRPRRNLVACDPSG